MDLKVLNPPNAGAAGSPDAGAAGSSAASASVAGGSGNAAAGGSDGGAATAARDAATAARDVRCPIDIKLGSDSGSNGDCNGVLTSFGFLSIIFNSS